MKRSFVVLAACGLLAGGIGGAGGCKSSQPATLEGSAPARPHLFTGLGSHHRAVTTTSPEAQRWFDQGLTLAYAFNHDEAVRSFTKAGELDPQCAMAWWGVALCHGPHINNPAMSPEASSAAWDALAKARAATGASPTERALIEALGHRYADPNPAPPKDRAPLDAAYAEAMRAVWKANPADADIGCLFAESMMDLRPWDLWMADGRPQPGTEEVVATLERVLSMAPDHPGANHLYIHAVEASPDPARAVTAADRLRTLVPASGHLVHMPAHIDIRTGRWDLAAEQNRRAITADAEYRSLSPKQGFYRVYMAHNHQFLAFACMMQGRREEGLAAARAMVEGVPPAFIEEQAALVDPYMTLPMDVLMRFGRWDEMLREPEPDARLPISRAMWRFGRAVAFAAKDDAASARREQSLFRDAVSAVPSEAMMAINRAHTVLEIAGHMLEGEIALAENDTEGAIAHFKKGVEVEDTLRYMEPPEWLHPVRHPLGGVLLESGRAAEAEAVFREDLRRWPENGWSLLGLSKSLRAQGRQAEADEALKRFNRTWARADTRVSTSCLCIRSK